MFTGRKRNQTRNLAGPCKAPFPFLPNIKLLTIDTSNDEKVVWNPSRLYASLIGGADREEHFPEQMPRLKRAETFN